jgi:hypothetical protein
MVEARPFTRACKYSGVRAGMTVRHAEAVVIAQAIAKLPEMTKSEMTN